MTTDDVELAGWLIAAGAKLSGFGLPARAEDAIGICLDVDGLEPLAELLTLYERGEANLDHPRVRWAVRVLRAHLSDERERASYLRHEHARLSRILAAGGEPD